MNHEKIKLECLELAYEHGEEDAVVLARAQKYFEFVTKPLSVNTDEEQLTNLDEATLDEIYPLLRKRDDWVNSEIKFEGNTSRVSVGFQKRFIWRNGLKLKQQELYVQNTVIDLLNLR